MNPVKELTASSGKTLKIYQDDDTDSPRNWDCLSKMICFHSRYNLGDKHDYKSRDYNSFDEMKKAIMNKERVAVILPMYMYDHSGITIKTTPFGCRWDSGQIGFVIVTKEAIRKEYSVKRVTKELIKKAESIALNEVEIYDQYLTGDVYRFEVEDEDGKHLDSCGGFYGSNFAESGMTDYINYDELVELLKAE